MEIVCGKVWDFLHQRIALQHLPQPRSDLDLGSLDVTTTDTSGEARRATSRHEHFCCREAPALFWQSKCGFRMQRQDSEREASLTVMLSLLPSERVLGKRHDPAACRAFHTALNINYHRS